MNTLFYNMSNTSHFLTSTALEPQVALKTYSSGLFIIVGEALASNWFWESIVGTLLGVLVMQIGLVGTFSNQLEIIVKLSRVILKIVGLVVVWFCFAFFLDGSALPFTFICKTTIIGCSFAYYYWFVDTLKLASVNSRILYEQFLLLLFGVLWLCGLMNCTNLLYLFVCFTGFSVTVYALIAQPQTPISAIAATKYWSLGLVSTAFLGLGCFLIYVEHISLDYGTLMANLFEIGDPKLLSIIQLSGFLFILLAFLFKLAAFPLYFWVADVYEGAAQPIMAFVVFSKLGIFFTLTKLLGIFYIFQNSPILDIFMIAGIGSLVVGTFGTFTQTRFKRFVAYTSINHMGFLLIALAFETFPYFISSIYVFGYIVANFAFLGALSATRQSKGSSGLVFLSELPHVVKQRPDLGVLLSLAIFSMAGIPPFIGFITKYLIILLTWSTASWVSIIAVGVILILLAASGYNYLRLIKLMFFSEPAVKALNFSSHLSVRYILSLAVITVVLFSLGVALPNIATYVYF